MKFDLKRNLGSKISILAFVAIFISTSVISTISFLLFRSNSIKASAEKATLLAESSAMMVDGDQFAQIIQANEKNDYWHEKKALFDEFKTNTKVEYVYALFENKDRALTYFLEGDNGAPEFEGLIGEFGEVGEEGAFAQQAGEALLSGQSLPTGVYNSEGFGTMVSGFAPILDAQGKAVGVVGVDLAVGEVLRSTNLFGLTALGLTLLFCVVSGALFMLYVNRSVEKPICQIMHASEQIAGGDLDIHLDVHAKNEIGRLAESFQRMAQSTQSQVTVLESITDGDLSVPIHARSQNDSMSKALQTMIDNLGEMVGQIDSATSEVLLGSRQIADGATTLAQGSTQQTEAVSELSESISQVAEKTRINAQKANDASTLSQSILDQAGEGTQHMQDLTEAVSQINQSSEAIGKIIKVIDDIAFQTNILALNAAVEAARAGAHGKGFAVVANEVRNLASKSADAAKETDSLIKDSMEKAGLGAAISRKTSDSLHEIVQGIQKNTSLVSEISASSVEQSQEIDQIRVGIDQVSVVVQQNSATSQQSAASSQELSAQANMLKGLVGEFTLE